MAHETYSAGNGAAPGSAAQPAGMFGPTSSEVDVDAAGRLARFSFSAAQLEALLQAIREVGSGCFYDGLTEDGLTEQGREALNRQEYLICLAIDLAGKLVEDIDRPVQPTAGGVQ